jgi:hypothetical protein
MRITEILKMSAPRSRGETLTEYGWILILEYGWILYPTIVYTHTGVGVYGYTLLGYSSECHVKSLCHDVTELERTLWSLCVKCVLNLRGI